MGLTLLSSQYMGTQMVRLVVGENAQPFLVHRNMLCKRFPHFFQPINIAFHGHGSMDLVLRDDKVEVIQALVTYIYQGHLPRFEYDQAQKKPVFSSDRIQEENISHGYIFSQDEIQEVYENSLEYTGLKHYLVMLMAFEMVQAQDADIVEACFNLGTLIPALMGDLTDIIEDQDICAIFNPNALGARTRLRSCIFHDHDSQADQLVACQSFE